jgi:hypothetical protein
MSTKYNIRSVAQLHSSHEDYYVPKGAQHSVRFSFTLEENLDREADPNANLPETDTLLHIAETPNKDLYNMNTPIKGSKNCPLGD